MPVTITVDVPRRGIGSDLTEALAAFGLQAEIVDSDEACTLHVTWAADERERLVSGAIHAIEAYLSDRMLRSSCSARTAARSCGHPRTEPVVGAGGAPLRHGRPTSLVRSYLLTQRAARSTV